MLQFIKFGMVGLCNSVLNYIIYIFCIKAGLHYVLANLIGFAIVIFIAYLLQKYIIFREQAGKEKQPWWKLLVKTYISYAFTGLFLNNLLSVFWLDIADVSVWCGSFYPLAQSWFHWQDERSFATCIVPFMNLVFTVPINFVLNKKWTYQQK